MSTVCETSDLLFFSHHRWDFLFHGPQHLVSRHSRFRRVYYIEEPVYGQSEQSRLHVIDVQKNIQILIPHISEDKDSDNSLDLLKDMLDQFLKNEAILDFTALYDSLEPFSYSHHLKPALVIYDGTHHLPLTYQAEDLLRRADLIFISGEEGNDSDQSYFSKVHTLPRSIEFEHFYQSRFSLLEPEDQLNIPHPRIGYFGVVNEKLNFSLIEKLADLRSDFQFVFMGPVVNVDASMLPSRPNIYYLGDKDYDELPFYLSGWDCSILPYYSEERKDFMGPMRTSELLASGKPVVATSLEKVIHPYEDNKLVYISDHPEHFIECIERAMNERAYDPQWSERVDQFLEGQSWDSIFYKMATLELEMKKKLTSVKRPAYMDRSLMEIGIV